MSPFQAKQLCRQLPIDLYCRDYLIGRRKSWSSKSLWDIFLFCLLLSKSLERPQHARALYHHIITILSVSRYSLLSFCRFFFLLFSYFFKVRFEVHSRCEEPAPSKFRLSRRSMCKAGPLRATRSRCRNHNIRGCSPSYRISGHSSPLNISYGGQRCI